jgi:hypothetical protein
VFSKLLTHGRSLVLGVNPFPGVSCTFVDGDCSWYLFLDQFIGEGKFDGRVLGRLLMVFLEGGGGERENVRSRSVGSFFDGRHVSSNSPIFYVLYHILIRGVSLHDVSDHRERCPRSSMT